MNCIYFYAPSEKAASDLVQFAVDYAKEENAKKWDKIADITLQVMGVIAGIVGLGVFFMFWSGKWGL